MVDSYVILAPILLLPILALLRFIGCNQFWGLNEVTLRPDSADVNCGGPAVDTFEADTEDGGTNGNAFTSTGGNHFSQTDSTPVMDQRGSAVSQVYGTCRVGTSFAYRFDISSGGHVVTLRFAEIGEAQNPGDRVFTFTIGDRPPMTYDIIGKTGARLVSQDEVFAVPVVQDALTIQFNGTSGDALVNAIQVDKLDAVVVSPAIFTMFVGQSQPFQAGASWSSGAAIAWSADSGQIDQSGTYTADSGILHPVQSQITASANNGTETHTGTATINVYLRRDTITKGVWNAEYGRDGYVLPGAPGSPPIPPLNKFPSYLKQFNATKLDGTALDVFTYANSAGDPRVAVDATGNPRPAVVWYDANAVVQPSIFSFEFKDSQPHLVGIYCLDFEPLGRVQTIQVTNAQGVLDTQTLANFGGGVYLFWISSGPIQIQVTPAPGFNAVVSGVFLR